MDENQYAAEILLDRKTSIPWPEGIPMPIAGDLVLIEHEGVPYSMKVSARLWAVAPKEETGEIEAIITIQAQSQPVGGQERASIHPLKF